jgi:hypothetical protein
MITGVANGKKTKASEVNVPKEYKQNNNGWFQIKDYDTQPAFASFLPGIGGPEGVPLWCLYVNRAQAISSFGIGNKDHAAVEFLPANWAYQLVGVQGFRTFCKVDEEYYEPFQNDLSSQKYTYQRTMWIEMDRLKIREENQTLGLRFEVTYFSPVNQPIGSLVRLLSITNLSSKARRLHCLDGLPLIIPAGFTDVGIKTMRRILEAYASVRLVAGHVPFYAAKVLAHDEAEVEEVRKGNFYAAWLSVNDFLTPVEPYYDSDLIFGSDQDLVTPREFIRQAKLDRLRQVPENKLPCAMAPFDLTLEPNDSVTLAALSGMTPNESMLLPFLSQFKTLSDFGQASQQSRQLIRSITQPAFMVSSKPQLDAYTRQNYLDNILRGGAPKVMPSISGPTLIHLYSRRHGDAERDYNYFDLPACPLSSGEGNYRDICQNRRSDIWFYPEVWDQEIRMFVSLLQADGYNPLSIKGYRWYLPEQSPPMGFCPSTDPEAQTAFSKLTSHCFLPGQLLDWANHYQVKIGDRMQWLQSILCHCKTRLDASGHEGGYWIDHWTYILDLVEAFQSIYPDRIEEVLTKQADIEWFIESAHVVDRKQKYIRRKNSPLQLDAVVDAGNPPMPLPPVTVSGKLCALLAIKAVSLDYEGRGIEMEAGRPGWNDAMNGLPGLFGSSTCETAETLRLAKWLLHTLPQIPDTEFPLEVAAFIKAVHKELQSEYNWDRSTTLREEFRRRIYQNTSNKTEVISGRCLQGLLEGIIIRFENSLNKSIDPETGLMHTYYLHKPVDAKDRKCSDFLNSHSKGQSVGVEINHFNPEPLPLFLEGQVHWLRVCSSQRAKQIYQAVQKSPLVDQNLAMYKLNESLERCSPEIGRARTFSRGWFENESIWQHMSSKYLLELVRNGLYEEFYTDAKTMLVPFMDPKIYGRSILENSSFIASSDCPDPQARGRGFVARLSGTTAEFIHIWLLLTVGKQPFKKGDGLLTFALQPVLPAEWFTEKPVDARWNEEEIRIPENAFACTLMGNILLVYHNPSRQNTYGDKAVHPVKYVVDSQETVFAPELTGALAEQVRQRAMQRIDVWLA